ncbi:unnamed protein product [Echinostoma caproni]|uniref:Uncharacterized protein n=1 Tax=Echinostoma caproni TaxID=27848 RepID=A0A183BBZ8_9TREM|nr:unnamed protein product [Echinostoma caproni]
MSPMDCSTPDEGNDIQILSRPTDWLGLSATIPPSNTPTPNDSVLGNSPISTQLSARNRSSEPSVNPLTPEQITEFMSKPTSSLEENDSMSMPSRRRSHSLSDRTKVYRRFLPHSISGKPFVAF